MRSMFRGFVGALAFAGTLLCVVPAHAAELQWEVQTPGGHLISHTTNLLEVYGTCLRKGNASGPRKTGREGVFISHLKWWAFVDGRVVGESRKGFFIFNERTQRIVGFDSEADLLAGIERRFGKVELEKVTPAETWKRVWLPRFMQQCALLKKNAGELAKMKPEERVAVQTEICEAVQNGSP